MLDVREERERERERERGGGEIGTGQLAWVRCEWRALEVSQWPRELPYVPLTRP